MRVSMILAGLSLIGAAAAASASEISVAAVDSGWYLQRTPVAGGSATYAHYPSNRSFAAGTSNVNLPTYLDEYRSFFVFDLAPIAAPVTAAVLRLQSHTYSSGDPSETYTLYDVSTSTSVLTAGGFTVGPVFDDLGTGDSYGSRVYSASDGGSYRDIPLNAQAIAAINAALGGEFAIGGAVTTLSYFTGGGATDELLFANYSSSFDQFLVLIPEPHTGLLLSGGILGLALRGRQARRQA